MLSKLHTHKSSFLSAVGPFDSLLKAPKSVGTHGSTWVKTGNVGGNCGYSAIRAASVNTNAHRYRGPRYCHLLSLASAATERLSAGLLYRQTPPPPPPLPPPLMSAGSLQWSVNCKVLITGGYCCFSKSRAPSSRLLTSAEWLRVPENWSPVAGNHRAHSSATTLLRLRKIKLSYLRWPLERHDGPGLIACGDRRRDALDATGYSSGKAAIPDLFLC